MKSSPRRATLARLAGPCIGASDLRQAAAQDAAASDRTAIEGVMKRQFDKPDAPLLVSPIVVEQAFALAGWTQGERGGLAMLKRDKGRWSIHVCGGDGLKQASALSLAGMPKAAALTLLDRWSQAEKALPPARVRLFSTFEGIVKVDQQGHRGH